MSTTQSLTIELPAPILAVLHGESQAAGQSVEQIVIDALMDRYAVFEGEGEGPDSDLMNALREGIADVDAGRVYTLEESKARTEALLNSLAKAQTEQSQNLQSRPQAKAA